MAHQHDYGLYWNDYYTFPYKSKSVYDLAKLAKAEPTYMTDWAYFERELLRHYGFESYGLPKGQMNNYIVYNETGSNLATYNSEASALLAAEDLAKRNPGRAFYVHKTTAITKSYVAPAPSITTRL